jgi:hypothetical protein
MRNEDDGAREFPVVHIRLERVRHVLQTVRERPRIHVSRARRLAVEQRSCEMNNEQRSCEMNNEQRSCDMNNEQRG